MFWWIVHCVANDRADQSDWEESSDEEDDEFAPYDPDELPSLEEAVRLLFPTLARRLGVGGSRSAASGTAEGAQATGSNAAMGVRVSAEGVAWTGVFWAGLAAVAGAVGVMA